MHYRTNRNPLTKGNSERLKFLNASEPKRFHSVLRYQIGSMEGVRERESGAAQLPPHAEMGRAPDSREPAARQAANASECASLARIPAAQWVELFGGLRTRVLSGQSISLYRRYSHQYVYASPDNNACGGRCADTQYSPGYRSLLEIALEAEHIIWAAHLPMLLILSRVIGRNLSLFWSCAPLTRAGTTFSRRVRWREKWKSALRRRVDDLVEWLPSTRPGAQGSSVIVLWAYFFSVFIPKGGVDGAHRYLSNCDAVCHSLVKWIMSSGSFFSGSFPAWVGWWNEWLQQS